MHRVGYDLADAEKDAIPGFAPQLESVATNG